MPIVKKVRGGNAKALGGTSLSRKNGEVKEPQVSLPTERNEPSNKFSAYTLLIHGEKGIGKSSLFAEIPNSITMMLEQRRRNLRIFQIPQEGEPPLTWSRVHAYKRKILAAKRFQHLTFDSADRLYDLCFQHICDRHNIKNPGQLKGYEGSQVWGEIKTEFEELLTECIYSDVTIGFTSHSRWKEGETVSGDKYETVLPTCTPACLAILKAITDFAFYYGYKDRERVLYLRGSSRIFASCGTSEEHFLDPKGNPLTYIPAGDSPKSAYKALCDSFNNKIYGFIESDDPEEGDDEDEDVELPDNKPKRNLKRRK